MSCLCVLEIKSLFIFVFIFVTLGDRAKKDIAVIYVKECSMFSSQNFIVSSLTFRSLIDFKFIFVYVDRECSNFIIYMQLSNFSSTTHLRDCLFSIIHSCRLQCRLIDNNCMSLFLSFPSCSIDLYICFCASAVLLQ